MKTLNLVVGLSTILMLGACSSSRYTSSRENDDVYYSSRDRSSDQYDKSNAASDNSVSTNGSNGNCTE